MDERRESREKGERKSRASCNTDAMKTLKRSDAPGSPVIACSVADSTRTGRPLSI